MARIVIPAGDSQAVYFRDGVEWVTAEAPPDEVVQAGRLVIYGGHEYDLDEGVIGELTEAGFEVIVTDIENDD